MSRLRHTDPPHRAGGTKHVLLSQLPTLIKAISRTFTSADQARFCGMHWSRKFERSGWSRPRRLSIQVAQVAQAHQAAITTLHNRYAPRLWDLGALARALE